MFGDERVEEELPLLALRAIQCAIDIQSRVGLYDSNEGKTDSHSPWPDGSDYIF